MISYDLSDIKNSDEVCWEYLPPDELEDGIDDTWTETDAGLFIRMNPITLALITAAEQVRLKSICQGNILEWIYRLNALFDAGKSVLMVETDEGPVPIRFQVTDLREHMGLKISVIPYAKEKFDAYIRQLRMHRHLACDDLEVI
jgi:hypothetical protein